jgi:hypothetical protein
MPFAMERAGSQHGADRRRERIVGHRNVVEANQRIIAREAIDEEPVEIGTHHAITGCVALRWHSRRGAIERLGGLDDRLALWHRDCAANRPPLAALIRLKRRQNVRPIVRLQTFFRWKLQAIQLFNYCAWRRGRDSNPR